MSGPVGPALNGVSLSCLIIRSIILFSRVINPPSPARELGRLRCSLRKTNNRQRSCSTCIGTATRKLRDPRSNRTARADDVVDAFHGTN